MKMLKEKLKGNKVGEKKVKEGGGGMKLSKEKLKENEKIELREKGERETDNGKMLMYQNKITKESKKKREGRDKPLEGLKKS